MGEGSRKKRDYWSLLIYVMMTLLIAYILQDHVSLKIFESHPKNVKKVLELAGNNRSELEEVLDHYHEKGDSLKLRAAYFLIENMPGCYEESWQAYRNGTKDTLFSLKPFRNKYDAKPYMDSLNIYFSKTKLLPDYQKIKSTFLIEHIDRVFQVWKQPGSSYLSFDEFKECLLPYRTAREKIENSYLFVKERYPELMKSDTRFNRLQQAIEINQRLKKEIQWNNKMTLYPGSLSCSNIVKLKAGHCAHLVNYGLKVFRAIGLPVGNDFVPAWGDTDNGHSWNVLFLEGKTIPFNACDDDPGAMPFYYRAPKVFRKTFQIQSGGIWDYYDAKNDIPNELKDRFRIDVTDQYYETIDVEINLKNKPKRNDVCAYLCVYNRSRWFPVDWGKIQNEKVRFSNINDSLLYCAMYYNRMEGLKPASNPFVPYSSTSIHYFVPDNNLDKVEKVFDYDYYRWNTTKPNSEYQLYMWNDQWTQVAKSHSYPCIHKDDQWVRLDGNFSVANKNVRYFVDFDSVPQNGLYKLSTDERPFWIKDGKIQMCTSTPDEEYLITKLFDVKE